MIRVADVERSVEFYRLLGFDVGNRVPPVGAMHWAWLYSTMAEDWKRGPNLMLTRGHEAIEPGKQSVLFYLYASDLEGLRTDLLSKAVDVSEISYPDYLPDGECCVRDPDGYVLMLAQTAKDTP